MPQRRPGAGAPIAGDAWAGAIVVALPVAVALGAVVRTAGDDRWALLASMATVLIVSPLVARRLRRGRRDEPPRDRGPGEARSVSRSRLLSAPARPG